MKSCAFCGKPVEKPTRDHVPPKGIFGKPLPAEVITVPACAKCNQVSAKDDEYFRLLTAELIASKVGDAVGATASLIRSILRPEAAGFRHTVFSGIKRVLVTTDEGIVVPSLAITVKTDRLMRIVEKTVRGLYYRISGEPLPEGMRVWVSLDDQLDQLPDAAKEEVRTTLLPALTACPEVTVGRDVFAYRYARDPDAPQVVAWWLEFYRRFGFVALTMPPLPGGSNGELTGMAS